MSSFISFSDLAHQFWHIIASVQIQLEYRRALLSYDRHRVSHCFYIEWDSRHLDKAARAGFSWTFSALLYLFCNLHIPDRTHNNVGARTLENRVNIY